MSLVTVQVNDLYRVQSQEFRWWIRQPEPEQTCGQSRWTHSKPTAVEDRAEGAPRLSHLDSGARSYRGCLGDPRPESVNQRLLGRRGNDLQGSRLCPWQPLRPMLSLYTLRGACLTTKFMAES